MNERAAPVVPLEEYEREMQRRDPSPPPFAARPASEYASHPPPPREFIADELIPSRTVTMISGDGGTGKSLLSLQLAVAATGGGYWCGRQVAQGDCLFISAEDDEDELHRRLHDISKGTAIPLSNLPDLRIRSLAGDDALLAVVDNKAGILKPTRLFEAIDQFVAKHRPMLIILDTLADIFGGEENNRAHARQFIGLLRGLCARYDATVVLLAHPSLSGMSSGSGSSGSTAWNNSVRSRLYLDRIRENNEEPDPDVRVLRTKKANYGRSGEEIKLRWVEGMFKPESGPDSFVVMAAQNGADRLFLDLLAQYAAQGRTVSDTRGANYAPSIFAKDPRANGTTNKGFEGAMMRLFADGKIRIETVGPPSKKRKSIVATD